jgi:hypothetical protein
VIEIIAIAESFLRIDPSIARPGPHHPHPNVSSRARQKLPGHSWGNTSPHPSAGQGEAMPGTHVVPESPHFKRIVEAAPIRNFGRRSAHFRRSARDRINACKALGLNVNRQKLPETEWKPLDVKSARVKVC